MPGLTPTAYVLLGMLRLGKRTGYEIKQLVDRSTRFFWAASYGQIYPELKRLEEAGLVRGEADPQGGRQRRAYALTPEGERALDDWLATPDVSLFELRDMALLKLFFADGLDAAGQAALARAASERHAGFAAALEEVEAEHSGDHHMTYEVLSFGLDFNRWCAERYAALATELEERE
jgi:DNA-binding PadR family transcriptional regulator